MSVHLSQEVVIIDKKLRVIHDNNATINLHVHIEIDFTNPFASLEYRFSSIQSKG